MWISSDIFLDGVSDGVLLKYWIPWSDAINQEDGDCVTLVFGYSTRYHAHLAS